MTKTEGMIDVHAHILPGVDDGAVDWDMVENMLRRAYGQGFRCVIATPHWRGCVDREKLERLSEELVQRACRIASDYRIVLGQEIMYMEGLGERLIRQEALSMAGSRYVLVEFPMGVMYSELFRSVRSLLTAGYIPVLAHVERYTCLRTAGRLEELSGMGARMQMNYKSIQESFISQDTRWCRRQIIEGNIHLLGTDMHNMKERSPETGKALRWLRSHCGTERTKALTCINARNILDNKIISG